MNCTTYCFIPVSHRNLNRMSASVWIRCLQLLPYLEEHGIRYPVVLGSTELAREYGAYQFPFHVLIGPDGRVLERLTPGFHEREELRELLERHREG